MCDKNNCFDRNSLSLIVAMDKNRVIGNNGSIPWDLPEDLKLFQKITKDKAVIMGRRTWESLPEQYRPLPERSNIVITSQDEYKAPGAVVVGFAKDALSVPGSSSPTVVIGGAEIYSMFLPRVKIMYISHVEGEFEGDTRFPEVNWREWIMTFEREYNKEDYPKNSHSFTFAVYERHCI
ncbi:MAG: dihydrofolate reductase [Candidatus Spechtbacterales bacterium]